MVEVDVQHDKHGLDEVALEAAQLARCQLRVLAILRIASANNRSTELHQLQGRRGTSANGEGSPSSPLLADHELQDKQVGEVRHDEQHRGERRIDEEDREEAHARVLIPHRPPPHPSVIMECELSAILGATEERQEQLHGAAG